MSTPQTKPTLPESISITTLSKWIDYSEPKKPQFCFQVQISHNGKQFITPYSGGILAFLKRDSLPFKQDLKRIKANSASNLGIVVSHIMGAGGVDYTAPAAKLAVQWLHGHASIDPVGVVSSLMMDMTEECFENWASEYGYDSDSRKAYAVYEACLKTTREMKDMFSPAMLETLREIAQDY